MNAVKEMYNKKDEKETVTKPALTIVNTEKSETKEETKYTKEYLNEKMYYFYNNGGPVMDI